MDHDRNYVGLPDGALSIFSTHAVHLKGYDAPEEGHALSLTDLSRLVTAPGG